ncbi:hypothetical protein M9Y10_002480 [Tritrichomonas musculus]|uniref:Leucine-rich repeat domain-containing protein n=1 Tax=Tritrichomonas musculus TaxID=1915356 RepID=A0ABR2L9Z8_9EUKA
MTKIMYYAFGKCNCLKKIESPSSVKEIGENIIGGCINIELTANIEVISSILFNHNPSVRNIGNRAFAGCNSLKSIEFSSSELEVGENIFQGINEINS